MASPLAQQFGRNLRRRRRGAGLTQVELASLSDVYRVEIGEYERGRRLPRLDTILKLSAGVAVSPCLLLAGLRWRPGYYVEGYFNLDEDGSGSAAEAERGDA